MSNPSRKKSTTSKSEAQFQSEVIKFIKSKGGYPLKTAVSSYQAQGEPDITCCYLGHYIAFELKIEGNKPSDLQLEKMRQIRKAGGIAIATKSIEEIEEIFNEISGVQSNNQSQ